MVIQVLFFFSNCYSGRLEMHRSVVIWPRRLRSFVIFQLIIFLYVTLQCKYFELVQRLYTCCIEMKWSKFNGHYYFLQYRATMHVDERECDMDLISTVYNDFTN